MSDSDTHPALPGQPERGSRRPGTEQDADLLMQLMAELPARYAWFVTFYNDRRIVKFEWVLGVTSAQGAVDSVRLSGGATHAIATLHDLDTPVPESRQRTFVPLSSAESLILENEDPRAFAALLARYMGHSGIDPRFPND